MARRNWTEQEEAYIDKFYEKRGVSYLANKLNRTEDSVKHIWRKYKAKNGGDI